MDNDLKKPILSVEDAEDNDNRTETDIEDDLDVYSVRWIILLLFVLSGVSNALVLLTWSPIADVANDYFGDIGKTAINLLTVMFQIMYLPGTIMAVKALQTYDLRITMLIAGMLTSIGCAVRYISVISIPDAYGSYSLVLIGTILVSLAQPFYLNMPAKIATAWFSISQRDISMTFCSLANPLGSAIGSLLPAMIVKQSETDAEDITGVDILLLIQFLVAVIALGLVAIGFQSIPVKPPSKAAARRVSLTQIKTMEQDQGTMSKCMTLLKNPNYQILLIIFSLCLGHLNALAALIGQLPGDYSNEEYGNLGAILILSGFFATLIAGFIINYTQAYRTILKITYCTSVAGWVFFTASCKENNLTVLLISAGLLGFSLLPIIPATIVNCAENTYPIPEDLALGGLYISANLTAICFTFFGEYLLTLDSFGDAPLFPYGLWVIISMGLGILPVLLYRGEYLRSRQDSLSKY